LLISGFILTSCKNKEKSNTMTNPLLMEFNTPFGVPPFDQIKTSDYIPAFREAIRIHDHEIEEIVKNKELPDFQNTIVALERCGSMLYKVQLVFSNLNSSLTSDSMQKIDEIMAPEISAHYDAIRLNEGLSKRVKAVYDNASGLSLSMQDSILLDDTYKYFVRGGANLSPEDKEKVKKINEELSLLSVKFSQNVLGETNSFKLVIDRKEDLSGLPDAVIYTAAEAAKEAGMEGKWVFTIQKPSMIPFLTNADNRQLREKLHKAYTNLANNGNEFDNNEITAKMIALRAERSELLGYKTHADYVLERNMAKTPEKVNDFLDQIWTKALPVAKAEASELQKLIDQEAGNFKLAPWDWWYYAEKLRKLKYDFDEEALRPYFVLENVRDGAFDVANKLWGITFKERKDVPKYHEEVQVFEVLDTDGSHLGILYMDFFPRASKRAGAWMSEFRSQEVLDGQDIRPVVTTNFNFSKPTGDKPALITFEEVTTLFHEFGHALQGLLSKCTYRSQAGTSVARDFVELCSQVMENWAEEPEVLKTFSRHYQTGEQIPDALLQKIEMSKYFNQGFVTVEYMSASLLDMSYHVLTHPVEIVVNEFEKNALDKAGMIPEIVVRYRTNYFSHIFHHDYSSGYYSYIWAEVLDADAFQAFKETGDLFDKATADAFRTNILERGHTDDPMNLYVAFRGKEPDITAMLLNRGLVKEKNK